MTATDAQVRIVMRERQKGKTQEQAAATANLRSRKTVARYEDIGRHDIAAQAFATVRLETGMFRGFVMPGLMGPMGFHGAEDLRQSQRLPRWSRGTWMRSSLHKKFLLRTYSIFSPWVWVRASALACIASRNGSAKRAYSKIRMPCTPRQYAILLA